MSHRYSNDKHRVNVSDKVIYKSDLNVKNDASETDRARAEEIRLVVTFSERGNRIK